MKTVTPRILWADLHNHNEIGYGRGTLARSYRIAAQTLDVFALTVHGHWPDPPRDDAKLADYHVAAFAAVRTAFGSVVAAANEAYRPGEFVTFIGYEWHSTRWGDYVVLFPGDTGDLHRAQDLSELTRFVQAHGAIMIPHHVAYRAGWRGLDWASWDGTVAPLVEVHSEHGCSFEREGPWPMLAHSMGGSSARQTIVEQLKAGRHFGFTAGTDTHFGHPGSHGEGITGIYAPAVTRHAVFSALRQRHTLACTGDRIAVGVDADGALPGDVLPATARRRFVCQVDPLGPLDYVEVLKNGSRCALWPAIGDPADAPGAVESHLVRVEWGWGRMGEADATDWKLTLQLEGGEITRVVPCFSSGESGVAKLNLIHQSGAREVHVESFTSRNSPSPSNGVVLELAGGPDTVLTGQAQAEVQGEAGGCTLRATLRQLREDDVWGSVLPRFSAPRIRLGRAYPKRALQMTVAYEDSAPGRRDTYVFKARQANGHTAWTSPYLFNEDGREATMPDSTP